MPVAALAAALPLAQYPVALPMPVGDNRLPQFLDDDELLVAQLHPDGTPAKVFDDVTLKLKGSGDFAFKMVNPVLSVTDQGGDDPAALEDGHMAFRGFLTGAKVLKARGELPPAAFGKGLPIIATIAYGRGGQPADPARLEGTGGAFSESVIVTNLTGHAAKFASGKAATAGLAQALDALRQVGDVYTPESDLQGLFPLPPSLSFSGRTTDVSATVFAPMLVKVTARLDAATVVTDAGGASVTKDQKGTRLDWVLRLPEDTSSGGDAAIKFLYSSARFRRPGIEVNADVVPLPSKVFTPPSGKRWSDYLAGAPDPAALAVLAQAGAASINTIGGLSLPLNRPGPGPVKVHYDLILESSSPPRSHAPVAAPARLQPWAALLSILAAGLIVSNAWWSWSRH
jgi:hypothetical protein